MRRLPVAMLGGLLPLAVGCQAEPKPVPMPPPAPRHVSAEQAADLQQALMSQYPGARLGRVVKVDGTMAAVGGLSPAEVKPGATLSFVDGDKKVVANGTAVSTDLAGSAIVVVDFAPASPGRPPQAGDAAVYLPTDLPSAVAPPAPAPR